MLRLSHIDLNTAALSLVTQKLTKHYRSATAWSLPKMIKLRRTMDAIEGMDHPMFTRWKIHAIHVIHGPTFPLNCSSTMDAIEGMDCGKTERLLLANI